MPGPIDNYFFPLGEMGFWVSCLVVEFTVLRVVSREVPEMFPKADIYSMNDMG